MRTNNVYLGVKPAFDGSYVPENSKVAFNLIALNPAGQRSIARGVTWQLVEEDWSYDWYLEGGQWKWRRTGRDIPVGGANGRVDLGAQPVVVGRDKLEAAPIASSCATRRRAPKRPIASMSVGVLPAAMKIRPTA
ncbi:MAG: hypothetical protein WDN76_03530 [Alphaproteobacteria bacterium]